MPIATDFEIQADKDIRYVGAAHGASGAGYYTVLELHRFLQGLADDASSSGDDLVDMAKDNPSDKSFDTIINLVNGYNIDDTAAEHLYGGSIIQSAGAVIYDGIQVIAGAGAHVEIIQNGSRITNAFWNTVPFGSSNKGLNPDVANGISHRFLLKVRTGGADIDGRRLLLQTREWGKTFSEFKLNGTGRGINVAALTFTDDLNNATASGTVATWSDIVNVTAGYVAIDADGNGTPENYYSEWDKGSRTIPQLYERMKYLSRRGTSDTLYGLNGELFRGITHEVTVTSPRTGSVSEGVGASWSGGNGQVLARDSAGTATKLWIQLLTGVAPTAGQTITIGAATVTAGGGTPSLERPLSFPFCGLSTGAALIGAYGFGVQAADLTVADKVFDLTNTLRQPPNQVSFSVTGLTVGGEPDSILVGPASGGVLQANQFTLNGALTGAAVTSVVVNEAIPSDTPASGTLRIQRANGAHTKHAYSSYNAGTKTFTIASHNFSTNNAANGAGAYITYIDKVATASTESFTAIYAANRDLFIRVRNGGSAPIKSFETVAVLGSTGGTVNAIRTSDA